MPAFKKNTPVNAVVNRIKQLDIDVDAVMYFGINLSTCNDIPTLFNRAVIELTTTKIQVPATKTLFADHALAATSLFADHAQTATTLSIESTPADKSITSHLKSSSSAI
jgi:hypothetical protein